jgi:hypothetical protein
MAADESAPIFGDIPLTTDARVNAGLRQCLHCDTPLNVRVTTEAEDGALLFAQCTTCGRVYLLDSMTFPA